MKKVPDRIRDMWRDVYVLFAKHYGMDCDKQESWNSFWEDAHPLIEKYQDIDSFIELIGNVSQLIYKLWTRGDKDET